MVDSDLKNTIFSKLNNLHAISGKIEIEVYITIVYNIYDSGITRL